MNAKDGNASSAARAAARPPKGRGRSGWDRRAAKASPLCSKRVCVHWVSRGRHAPNQLDGERRRSRVPRYAKLVRKAAERSWRVQVKQLGWRKPKRDRGKSGTKQLDIFLSGGNESLIDTDDKRGHRRSAYVVIDSKLATAAEILTTVAHEFNHVLQFATDYWSESWQDEAVASYMEEVTYPQFSEHVSLIDELSANPGLPITDLRKAYGVAAFNHFLAAKFGHGVVRRTYEVIHETNHFALAAYDQAIRAAGARGLVEQLVAFYSKTAELRASGLPDAALYEDVRRTGQIAVGQSRQTTLDHTSSALFDVPPTDAGRLVLRASVPAGLGAGIALVGRRGDEVSGTVVEETAFTTSGGTGQVVLANPGSFDRITAVIINADFSARKAKNGSFSYLRDDQTISFSLTE